MNQPSNEGGSAVSGMLVLSVFSAMLGMFQFGYNTGVINAPQHLIENFVNHTYHERNSRWMEDGLLTFLWGFTVAVFAVGGMIGGFIGGWWANKFGRKNGMLINSVIGLAGALFMGTAKVATSFELLIIGRFVVGFSCGLYTALCPMYLTEIAPVRLRGALGTCNQFGVVIGLLLAQVFGIPDALGTELLWPLLLAISGVSTLLQLVCLPWCPESPRFLLLARNDEPRAAVALQKLRNLENVDEEIKEVQHERQEESSVTQMTLLELIRSRPHRLPLVICIVMQLSQQLSGINAVFYYSTDLFVAASVPRSTATYATIGVGGVMVTMTIVSIFLMDRAGRRTLHLIGLGGMMIFSVALTIFMKLRGEVPWFSYLAVGSALIYVMFFALGPGSIPWMITAELFAQSSRSAAVSIAVLVNWAANITVAQAFPFMQKGLLDYSFLPFTALLLLFWLFTFVFVPETKGKSIEEITAMFKKRHKAPGFKVNPNDTASEDMSAECDGSKKDSDKLVGNFVVDEQNQNTDAP